MRQFFLGGIVNVMIELELKIKASDLYDYLLYHTYNSAAGIMGSAFGALIIVIALYKQRWIYLAAGIIVLVYLPWNLFIKSRQQAMNPTFKKPLHYLLDESGLTISQDEVSQQMPWEEMYKAVSTSKSIILYTSKYNATIFPKRDLEDRRSQLIEIISTHMPPSKVKIRS